jgi:hypothetical protein
VRTVQCSTPDGLSIQREQLVAELPKRRDIENQGMHGHQEDVLFGTQPDQASAEEGSLAEVERSLYFLRHQAPDSLGSFRIAQLGRSGLQAQGGGENYRQVHDPTRLLLRLPARVGKGEPESRVPLNAGIEGLLARVHIQRTVQSHRNDQVPDVVWGFPSQLPEPLVD